MHWIKDGELGHYTIEASELEHCKENHACPSCDRTGTFHTTRTVKDREGDLLFKEARCTHCNAKLVVLND